MIVDQIETLNYTHAQKPNEKKTNRIEQTIINDLSTLLLLLLLYCIIWQIFFYKPDIHLLKKSDPNDNCLCVCVLKTTKRV